VVRLGPILVGVEGRAAGLGPVTEGPAQEGERVGPGVGGGPGLGVRAAAGEGTRREARWCHREVAMAFIGALILIVALGGVLARLLLATGPKGRARADEDVTDRTAIPPAHPDGPIPGSATRRRAQGKP
jgi:hypothetical protein